MVNYNKILQIIETDSLDGDWGECGVSIDWNLWVWAAVLADSPACPDLWQPTSSSWRVRLCRARTDERPHNTILAAAEADLPAGKSSSRLVSDSLAPRAGAQTELFKGLPTCSGQNRAGQCREGEFKCKNENRNQILTINDFNKETMKCIPNELRCDGRWDLSTSCYLVGWRKDEKNHKYSRIS